MEIDQLDLAEPALSGAILLQLRHPYVVFTSGRRGVTDQARAMASNVVRNRRWIDQTYADTADGFKKAVTGQETLTKALEDAQASTISTLKSQSIPVKD